MPCSRGWFPLRSCETSFPAGAATVTRTTTDNAEVNLTATITDADGKTSTKTIKLTVVAEDGDSGGGTSATGTLDTSFGGAGFVTHNGPADGIGYAKGYSFALNADGKILVAGDSENSSGDSDMVIWRYQ